MKIGKLLNNNNFLSAEISLIDYHTGLLNADVEDLEIRFPKLKGKTDAEKAKFIFDLYKIGYGHRNSSITNKVMNMKSNNHDIEDIEM